MLLAVALGAACDLARTWKGHGTQFVNFVIYSGSCCKTSLEIEWS